jgi:hypothetical protein
MKPVCVADILVCRARRCRLALFPLRLQDCDSRICPTFYRAVVKCPYTIDATPQPIYSRSNFGYFFFHSSRPNLPIGSSRLLPLALPSELSPLAHLKEAIDVLARSERFELPTPRFEVWCSIRLSYERIQPDI